MYQKWESKVTKFTYDEKANQWFWFWVKKLAKEEYWISLPIRELKYPSDKVTHFTPHVPHFRANRVYLPKNHKRINTLVDQIIAFPTKEVNDDAVDLLSGLLDNFHKNRWPVWEVIQWNDEIMESFEIDDMWMLPEDMEEEETLITDVEMSPY
jgi:predicted phage terminase large subunit-like protein